MDSFPFPYYVLVQQLESLPQLVSDLLKQWFELSAAS
jgi:midasin